MTLADGLGLFAALAGFAWFSISGREAGLPGGVLALVLVVLAAGPWLRVETRLVAVVGASTAVATMVVPPWWPLVQLTVGGPAVAVALLWRRARLRTPWLCRGRFDPWPVIVLGSMAAVALLGWALGLRPDLGAEAAMVPRLPWPLLLLAALGFSVTNALMEEVVFRGLLQGALHDRLGPVLAVVLQGAAFGVLHWHGVPSGPLGAAMAGGWGMMLGWARLRSGGLLTPVVAHVAADLMIFALLLG